MSFPLIERQHQKKPNLYQWATVPCAYWLRQTQLNLVGLILIGIARLSRSYIQIKNFLNSYRAGAHSNLVTLDVSALFSVALFYRKRLPQQQGDRRIGERETSMH